jgi:hypothetical protein
MMTSSGRELASLHRCGSDGVLDTTISPAVLLDEN